MNKEICFKINNISLYVEKYLVELNIPIFFICKDDNNSKYAVICTNVNELNYLILKIDTDYLINLLKNEITLRDFFQLSSKKWIVNSGNSLENDIVNEISVFPEKYLPKENEYLDLNNRIVNEYLDLLYKQKYVSKTNVFDFIGYTIFDYESDDVKKIETEYSFHFLERDFKKKSISDILKYLNVAEVFG